jgi:hypothetical protein
MTLETFSPHVGSEFEVAGEPEGSGPLVLTAAEPARGPAGRPGERRPFSLLFQGPPGVVLPQGSYRLEHVALGTLEIFIVPIGADAAGTRYEAVFN